MPWVPIGTGFFNSNNELLDTAQHALPDQDVGARDLFD